MQPLLCLRNDIAALRIINEVQDIDQEIELDLEVGAIIRRCYETGCPAPLFNRVRGVPDGVRTVGAPAGLGRQPGLSPASERNSFRQAYPEAVRQRVLSRWQTYGFS